MGQESLFQTIYLTSGHHGDSQTNKPVKLDHNHKAQADSRIIKQEIISNVESSIIF